jgi:hypothetical protein
VERFTSTKFLLCVAYMALVAGMAFTSRSTDDVLKLAEALARGLLYYCGANMGITMAYAIKGDPAKPEPPKPVDLQPNA